MATLKITSADRDAHGRIMLDQPRSLADLLPPPDDKRQPTAPARRPYAAFVTVALLAAFALVWSWPADQTADRSAPAQPLPTARVAAPTHAPLPTMTPIPTDAPALILAAPAPTIAPEAPIAVSLDAEEGIEAQNGAGEAALLTAPAIIPEDLVQLNDPALNGNNLAPPGCPFPIINGICGNGALAKDIPDVPPRDGARSSK